MRAEPIKPEWLSIRKIRCPKCGEPPSCFDEMWVDHGIRFDVDGDMRCASGDMFEGSPVRVIAECSGCRNRWALRGVTQITELDLAE